MRHSVLFVGDDQRSLTTMCELLASHMPSVSVMTAGSAQGALRLVQQYDYDAIVSDIRTPDTDALQLLGQIHQSRPDLPVLWVTSDGDQELERLAREEHAALTLRKPIDTELFLAWLLGAVDTRRLSDLDQKTERIERDAPRLEQASDQTAQRQALDGPFNDAKHMTRHLAALVESSEDAIISTTTGGIIQSWNRGAWDLYGYRALEVVGRHISVLIPADRQEEEARIRESIVAGNRVQAFETMRVTKNGASVPISLTMSPIFDEEGQVVAVSKIARDISERNRAKERIQSLLHEAEARERQLVEQQAQLVHAAKLASIGELTTGIAHELNNPLNNIGIVAGNVVDKLGAIAGHESVLSDLAVIKAQVKRAANIINHLRTFGRASSERMEAISLNDVIRSSVSFVTDTMRLANITVHLDLCPQEPVVLGNGVRLEQVFVNLCTNARDAMEAAEPKQFSINSRIDHGVVEVIVCDTGSGIAAHLLPRIFDPFFTTKPEGQGTGLGLSITYGIIKEHHGDISVQSAPENGTKFVIQFPIVQPQDPVSQH